LTAPLRVALDARRAVWMRHTGIGRYVGELLRHAHVEPRIRFVGLLAAGQEPIEGDADWLRLRPGLGAAARLVWEQVAEPYAVRRGRADILHLPWYEGPPMPGVPLVLTVQDLVSLSKTADLPPTFVYYNTLLRVMARRARRVIAPSRSTAADLHRLGVAPERICVVPYGHDARLVAVRATGPPLGHTRTVLYCGGYGARKRLDVMIEAAQKVLIACPGTRFVLVGSVPADVHALIARHRVGADFDMPGRVTDSELRDLYASADACVYPSEHEGFGFPALDALTAGVPLVACDASSVPEIAAGAGWLVTPGNVEAFADALTRVLRADAAVTERVAVGSRRALEFSWEKCIAGHAAAYLEAAFD
jgi:glycosyltransferase involved in cell wall biosynthesis